jgi:hypothetical protein
MATTRIIAGDEDVVIGDQAIETTDRAIETTDEAVQAPVLTPDLAAGALVEALGPLVDADYVPGKTAFRDALCDRFGLSELEAEELVDELEASGRIRFTASPEGLGWHIHHADEGA